MSIETMFGDLDKIDILAETKTGEVVMVLVCNGFIDGSPETQKALLDKMEELVVDPSVVFISHGDCGDEARELGEAIKAKFPVEKLVINYVGPVIGNHSGPGTMALFFQGKHR